MKKNFLFLVILAFCISTATFAQVSATPEVPKNYKPQAKELLPMPGELTDEMIFPVLGNYEYTDKDGNVSNVSVSRDVDNKGIVWVNGLPQGRFKAALKASPSTYKIPAQKTLQNETQDDLAMAADSSSAKIVNTRFSGKSLQEGTLIFDSTSNKLYVNIGRKFNEENPVSAFPEIESPVDTTVAVTTTEEDAPAAASVKKTAKKKAVASKGTTYILAKIIDESEIPAATDSN